MNKIKLTLAILLASVGVSFGQSVVATVPGWTHGQAKDYVFSCPPGTWLSSWFDYDVYEWQPGHPIWGLTGWYGSSQLGNWNNNVTCDIVIMEFPAPFVGSGTPGYIEVWLPWSGGRWLTASAPTPPAGCRWVALKFRNYGVYVSASICAYGTGTAPSAPSQIEQYVY